MHYDIQGIWARFIAYFIIWENFSIFAGHFLFEYYNQGAKYFT